MDHFLQHHELYNQLPMKHSSVLPDEGMDWTFMPVTRHGLQMDVKILPITEAREIQARTRAGLVYRVIVRCPCGKEVPFGKMNQHYHSKTCLNKD